MPQWVAKASDRGCGRRRPISINTSDRHAKIPSALIVIPLGLIFIVFAVANRHFVTVSFDPFNSADPSVAIRLPLFIVIILVAIIGVVAGGSATWFRQRRWRRAARQHEADARAARSKSRICARRRWPRATTESASRLPRRGSVRDFRARQAGRDVVEPAPPDRFQPGPAARNRDLEANEAMSLLVKICGLSTRETLEVALDAGADMVGFVFFPPSPRHLSLETARDLGRQAKRRAVKVALTVDADDATLSNIVEALQPDILQLHGKETTARLRDIKQKFGLELMKAIAVESAADLAALPGYAAVADRILFDARPPKGATRPGGLGAVFDWHVLEHLDLKPPFMVSGGLNAENVADALRVTRAGGVDVSSGVEREPASRTAR